MIDILKSIWSSNLFKIKGVDFLHLVLSSKDYFDNPVISAFRESYYEYHTLFTRYILIEKNKDTDVT